MIQYFSVISAWTRSTCLRVLKFLEIKEGGPNFWGKPIWQNVSIIWSPILYFNFNFFFRSRFFIIHYISIYSAWFRETFLRVFKFLEIKKGGSNFWGEPILQNVWIIWSSLLYFNFKSFLDPNSSSFIRFQSFLHESGVRFSESWNFCKFKSGDLISGGN